MSATATEIRGFDQLILNMQTCNDALFDSAQSWHRANRLEYAVFGSICAVLRASYCRHTYNGYGDTFTWIIRLEYAKLQVRWIWLGPDLTRLKPDEALCVWQSMWNITRIELFTYLQSKFGSRWSEYLFLNMQNCILAGFGRDQGWHSSNKLKAYVSVANV